MGTFPKSISRDTVRMCVRRSMILTVRRIHYTHPMRAARVLHEPLQAPSCVPCYLYACVYSVLCLYMTCIYLYKRINLVGMFPTSTIPRGQETGK